MKIEDIFKIAYANPNNRYITQHLDDKTISLIVDIMEKLDSNDFKEINPSAEFEFDDIPIPYKKLTKQKSNQSSFSQDSQYFFRDLLNNINKEGTNVEYPFIIRTANNSKEYSKVKEFEKGSNQNCNYDWAWIEEYIKNSNKKIRLSLLHTHPNPLNNQHNTFFNKYPQVLSEIGVQPNGLNISLADVYAEQYLEMLVKKYDKDIDVESTILMHDGTLISFNTNTSLTLTNELKIEDIKTNTLEQELTL